MFSPKRKQSLYTITVNGSQKTREETETKEGKLKLTKTNPKIGMHNDIHSKFSCLNVSVRK